MTAFGWSFFILAFYYRLGAGLEEKPSKLVEILKIVSEVNSYLEMRSPSILCRVSGRSKTLRQFLSGQNSTINFFDSIDKIDIRNEVSFYQINPVFLFAFFSSQYLEGIFGSFVVDVNQAFISIIPAGHLPGRSNSGTVLELLPSQRVVQVIEKKADPRFL